MAFSEDFIAEGHLIDSGSFQRMLDAVVRTGGEFEVLHFHVGTTNESTSRLQLRVMAESEELLSEIRAELHELGAERAGLGDVRLETCETDGVAPLEFYSTTNHPTEVSINGRWRPVGAQRMDAAIIVDGDEAQCRKLRDLRRGDAVVCGTAGVRIHPPARRRERDDFAFMSGEVSSERRVHTAVSQLAGELERLKASGGKIVWVAGPVVVHTGGSDGLVRLIESGFVSSLLAGNALAVHDVERALFGTSLGVQVETGLPMPEGHRHHMKAINRVRHSGSLSAAVRDGWLTSGVMHACVTREVPYVLAGSLRDDGPLPDVITDIVEAQDAYASELAGAELVILLGSMLHGIAVGNMLPSTVHTICVDINPAVVTKLVDRGSSQTHGLVTDVGLFLHLLADRCC
ncbi:MAG: TIGR00300 family protein [Planctomycetota bacterium]